MLSTSSEVVKGHIHTADKGVLLQILLEYEQDFQEWQRIVAGCLQLLEDSEVRVREAICSCTRLLAEQHSAEVVQSMQASIVQSIEHNWVRLHVPHVTPVHHMTRHLQHAISSLAPQCMPRNQAQTSVQ